MAFIKNYEDVARRAMQEISPELVDRFVVLMRFLAINPDSVSGRRRRAANTIGSEYFIHAAAADFARGRQPKAPEPPTTVPDEMVSVVLASYWGIGTAELNRIKQEHQLSMAAENIVGELLERYLASVLEPLGWVWCSGSLVSKVDFIKAPTAQASWKMLQTKNRDNSENSSSSSVREGTSIEKWFRTFSRREATNWAAFPDTAVRNKLSENDFIAFAKAYLKTLK